MHAAKDSWIVELLRAEIANNGIAADVEGKCLITVVRRHRPIA